MESNGNSTRSKDYEVIEQSVEDGRLHLKVQVDGEKVDEVFKRLSRSLSRMFSIPGFRKGRAPLSVIMARVGRERFLGEVEREFLPRCYYEALEETGHVPADEVQYVEKSLEKGRPFVFRAEVDVYPDVELGDYSALDLEFEPPSTEVSDAEVEEELERLRWNLAKRVEPAEGEELRVRRDDFVSLELECSVDGRRLHSFLPSGGYFLDRWREPVPGLLAGIEGASVGEERTFEIEVPADYEENPALAGKRVAVKAVVKEIHRFELPEVDDEFASKVSDGKDLASLKEALRGRLEERRKRKWEEALAAAIRKALVKTSTLSWNPVNIVEKQVQSRMEDLRGRFRRTPYSFEEYLGDRGSSEEAELERMRGEVYEEIVGDRALMKIAVNEGLEVSDRDVEQELRFIAMISKIKPDDFVEHYDALGMRPVRKWQMMARKAMDFLKEKYRMRYEVARETDGESEAQRQE